MDTIVFDSVQAPDGSLVFDAPTAPEVVSPSRTISDGAFAEWLKSDDAITNILVETWALVDGVRTPFYWSTNGYTTEGTNNPVFYAPVIGASIPFTEELSLSSSTGSLSAGDIEIDNTNGANEHYGRYIWADEFVALVGDQRWSRADYREMFVGHSAGLVRKDRAFALRLRDMMEGLNYPLSERKFGGTGPNADALIPLTFGECFNPAGEWSDAAALERQWHPTSIEGIPEVRASGLPITEQVLVSEATGKAVLTVENGSAAITATVQGDKAGGVFRKTIATLVHRFITGYGKDRDRYSLANIDAVNFAAFDAANQQPVGLHARERLNVIDAIALLAGSVGAQLAPSLDGQLQLIQIALPAAGVATEIRAEHMKVGTLKHVRHIDPIAAVKLGYCKNWTPQPGLQSNLPAGHRALFEKEWPFTVTSTNLQTKRDYKIDGEPEMRGTMFLHGVDAQAEADRELALWGAGRDEYEFEGVCDLLFLRKGGRLIVYHELDDMLAGVEAQVLSITRNWWTREVKVRFLK